jgi:hypothetical protein
MEPLSILLLGIDCGLIQNPCSTFSKISQTWQHVSLYLLATSELLPTTTWINFENFEIHLNFGQTTLALLLLSSFSPSSLCKIDQ